MAVPLAIRKLFAAGAQQERSLSVKIIHLVAFLFLPAFGNGAAATFVYVDNDIAGPNSVSAFAVSATGVLTPIPGSPFATAGTGFGGGGYAPNRVRSVIVKDTLYVSNGGSHDISAFSIDPNTGALTLVAGSPFAAAGPPSGPLSLAATPDNQFLYAGGNQSGKINGYTIDASGALHPIPGFPIDAGGQPIGMTTTPVNGKFLAVTLNGLGTVNKIAMFAINLTTGTLSAVTGSPFAGPPEPSFDSVASVDCNCAENRLFASIANSTNAQIAVFSIDPTGVLAPIGGSPFTGPGVNSNVGVLSPDDTKLFVSNQFSHTVDAFNVDSNGALTSVAGSPFSDGTGQPAGMATDAAGQWLFTANGLLSSSIGSFSIDANGALTAAPGSPFTTGLPAGAVLESLAVFPPKNCCPAPVISGLSTNPDIIWPPNHKFVPVTIDYSVAEPCPNTCVLTVASSEPGIDNKSPDWEVIDSHHVMVRAERDGKGPGRVYTITATCTNNTNGLSSAKQVQVLVPHDQGHD